MSEASGAPFERPLALLQQRSLEIARLRDVDDVLGRALDCGRELTGSPVGFIDLLDQAETRRETALFRGVEAGPDLLARHLAIPLDAGLAGVVIAEGRIVRSNDVRSDPAGTGWPPGHPPKATFLGAPLLVPDGVIGMIAVADRDEGYGEEHARLLGTFANQVAVAVENARLYQRQRRMIADLERLQAQLRAARATDAEVARRSALDQLVAGQEEERRRIAEDIHADSLQVLDAAILRLEMLSRRIADPAQAGQVSDVKAAVGEAESRLRHLLFDLRPPAIEGSDGLRWALQDHLERIGEAGDIRWELDVRMPDELTISTRLIIFRIAQEAIANVVKHARASLVRVRAEPEDEGVLVRVEDDGRGFSAADGLSPPGHFGLSQMRGRAELAGGWFHVGGRPGGGTVVDYWIPRGP
jgi:signal transduction histidine kinase